MAPRTLNLYLDLGGWMNEGPRDATATCEGLIITGIGGRDCLHLIRLEYSRATATRTTLRVEFSYSDSSLSFTWRRSDEAAHDEPAD